MQLDGQKALMPRAPGMERRTVAGFSRHLKKYWRSAISGLLICLMMLASDIGIATVMTFGFTSCSDVCPLLAANLTVIQTELANEDRARTGFLFITTDPEYDRAAVLREYGIKLGADFSNWKFLTGDLEALRPVWGGFGVSVRKLGPGHVDHITLTTVVDREGIRRVNYYGTRWRPETVMGDILAWAHDEARKL